jgi:molybdenum cofactor cytidylyltransferase/nicotine blue oxidoreductase
MLDKGTIAIAILAAGRGSRFGSERPKSLGHFGNRPLLSYALDAARQSEIGPVMVVLGYEHQQISPIVENAQIIYNPNWSSGLSSSLRAVIKFLEPQDSIQAVCIGLADQPLIGPQAYRSLASSYQKGSIFSVATYQGVRANPVLLGRPLWQEVSKLNGDIGAKELMQHYPVLEVSCDATGNPQDVDTQEDLVTLNSFFSTLAN